MGAAIHLGEFWELCLEFQQLNEEKLLFVSLHLVVSLSESSAGALWEQVPEGHLEACHGPWTHTSLSLIPWWDGAA